MEIIQKRGEILLLIVLLFPVGALSQDQLVGKGLLRSQGGFCSGYMPAQKATNVYIDGTLEYYFQDHFSVRADTYYYLGSLGEEAPFQENHSTVAGFCYHFTPGHYLDPYAGIQPGVAFSQRNPDENSFYSTYPDHVDPVATGVFGINYYAPAIFHALLEVRYLGGRHLSDIGPEPLNEWRITFGLGLDINVKNPMAELRD